jgi:hypothetical protein
MNFGAGSHPPWEDEVSFPKHFQKYAKKYSFSGLL